MSNLTFGWCVDLNGSSGGAKFSTVEAKYGDGYSQATSVGINNRTQEWSVSRTALKAEITAIKNFLDARKGADSFLWDSPFDGVIRVKASEYQLSPLGGLVWKISTTFSQVFNP